MAKDTLGVVLAGGKSQRMGVADKFLLLHRDRTLLQHCLDLALPQVDELVISANGDPARLANYQLPVVQDLWSDHPGPLAGIISVMSWAQKARKPYTWLATFAADTPYFPADVVARLRVAAEDEGRLLAVARTEADVHYTFALWSMSLLPNLQRFFNEGIRALHKTAAELQACQVPCSGVTQDFVNLNKPEDWDELAHV